MDVVKEAISVNELIARNVYRLRHVRKWTQAELAERLTGQTGDSWDYSMVSKAEWNPHRKRRPRRQWSPDELVAVARVFDVPLQELYIAGDEEWIDMGGAPVRGGDFFRLVFWIPEAMRHGLSDSLYGGVDDGGRPRPNTRAGFQWERFQEATNRLIESGFDVEVMADFLEEKPGAFEEVTQAYLEVLGVEMFQEVFGSPRIREWVGKVVIDDKEGDEDE